MADEAKESAAPAPAKKGRKWKLILAAVVLVPFAGFALYTWVALSFAYSTGERAGFLQKYSQKGWLCKTWEGEIAMVNMPGAMSQMFEFTVRNDSIAALLNGMSGQRVGLSYEQHKGVPTTCFGETEYYVVGVQKLSNP